MTGLIANSATTAGKLDIIEEQKCYLCNTGHTTEAIEIPRVQRASTRVEEGEELVNYHALVHI